MKELLVVYKEQDERFFKQIKSLVDSMDDTEIPVGVEDGTTRIIRCPQEKWIEHVKAGRENRLAKKILFIDPLLGSRKANTIFCKYGITFGVIENTKFVIRVDENYRWKDKEYEIFLEELRGYSEKSESVINAIKENAYLDNKKSTNGLLMALGILVPPLFFVGGTEMIVENNKKTKNLHDIRNQQLYYGISKAYYDELDKFMKA